MNSHNLIIIFISFLLFWGISAPLNANSGPQHNLFGVTLKASNELANVGDIVHVKIRVAGFDNIHTMKFSMNWNVNLLQYNSVTAFNLTGLDISDFGTTQTNNGILTLNWSSTGATVSDNTVIFELVFNVLASSGAPTPVIFSDIPTPIQVVAVIPPIPVPLTIEQGSVNINSNCSSPVAGLSCETAPLLCGGELEGYCGRTGPLNNQTIPNNFCGSVENNEWISFLAGSTSMQIKINLANCSGSPLGTGLQIIAFHTNDCQDFEPVSNCLNTSFNTGLLNLTNLTIGEKYYIMFDGWGGDMCDYTLQVLSGSAAPTLAMADPISGNGAVCTGQTIHYSIPPVAGALGYTWTAPAGATINASNNEADIHFGNNGGNICVSAYNLCDTVQSCMSVSVSQAQMYEVFETMCQGDCFEYNNTSYCTPGIYEITIPTASGCDSTILLNLNWISTPVGTLNAAICAGTCYVVENTSYCNPGSFLVTIPNGSHAGCDSTFMLNLSVIDLNVQIAEPATLTCSQTSVVLDASATSVQPAGTNLTYSWSDGVGNLLGSGVQQQVGNPGAYSLNVVATLNNISCSIHQNTTVSQEIILPEIPFLFGAGQSCENVLETYHVNPDPAALYYRWTVPSGALIVSGDSTASIQVNWNGIIEGQICVSAVNACGQSQDACMDVSIEHLPQIPAIEGSALVCENTVETYQVQPINGVISYNWVAPPGAVILTGQGTPLINIDWNQSSGGNICLVAVNGCGSGDTICLNVQINDPTSSLTLDGATTLCDGSVQMYTASGGSAGQSYQWDVPPMSSILSGQGTASIQVDWNGVPGGQVCFMAQTACGVSPQICALVELSATPAQQVISGNSQTCTGFMESYYVPSSDDITQYHWSVPSGGADIIFGQGTPELTVQWNNATGGTICFTPENTCGPGPQSCFNVSVGAAPALPVLTGPDQVCEGDVVQYQITPIPGAIGYSWSVPAGADIINGQGTAVLTVSFAQGSGGSICFTAYNDCGDSPVSCTEVVVHHIPVIDAGNNFQICGSEAMLQGTSDAGVSSWTNMSGSGGNAIFSDPGSLQSNVQVSLSGDYTFILTADNNGCSSTDSLNVTFWERPQVLQVSDSCLNDMVAYRLYFSVANGQLPYSVNGLSGNLNSNLFESDILASGTAFSLIVSDANGCVSDTLTGQYQCICVSDAGTLQGTGFFVCGDEMVTALPSGNAVLGGNDTAEFLLHDGSAGSIGSILDRNNNGQFHFVSSQFTYNTTYYISYVVGNALGTEVDLNDPCLSISNSIPIVFRPSPMIQFTGDSTICHGQSTPLHFNLNGNGPFTIQYMDGNNALSLNGVLDGDNLVVNPLQNTTYRIVSVMDSSQPACITADQDSVTIQVRPLPVADAGPDLLACEDNTVLNGNQITGLTGQWTTSGTAQIAHPENAQTSVDQLPDGNSWYIWTLTDANCPGSADTDTLRIFHATPPQAENDDFSIRADMTLTVNVLLNDTLFPNISWNIHLTGAPPSGIVSEFLDGILKYLPDSTFSGTVTFPYEICSQLCPEHCDTALISITVTPKPVIPGDDKVIIPNAITPNGDGANDVLIIDNLENYPNNELILFNRWGDVFYRAKPYQNDWNGMNANGNPMPEGTYYYLLRLDVGGGIIYRGDITILR